jgi:hypothetical protein
MQIADPNNSHFEGTQMLISINDTQLLANADNIVWGIFCKILST